MTSLDAVLAKNTAFNSMADLVNDLRTTNYHPSIRCDLDLDLIFVVAALDDMGLGDRCYTYFPRLDGSGITTCWGLPAKRLADLAIKAPQALSKHETMERAALESALHPPCLPDKRGRTLYLGSTVWFASGSAHGGHPDFPSRQGVRIGNIVKIGRSRVTVEHVYKNGRVSRVTVRSVDVVKARSSIN